MCKLLEDRYKTQNSLKACNLYYSFGIVIAALLFVSACESTGTQKQATQLDSLSKLSIEFLRNRDYGSTLKIEKRIANAAHETLIASYNSDDLRVYSRIDLPSAAAAESGYPVVVFVHGWMGVDAAPSSDFYMDEESNYARMITAYVDAGFVVLTPGWRGHGTVNGIPAEGLEFMTAWDNSTYLSPVFYAIDVLNLFDSLATLEGTKLDLGNINLVSHSQGGDVALIALAVAGEGSKVGNQWSAASFWSACFPARATQFLTYNPMQKTPEAFLSGDGSWNGTALGANGEKNPNFVFGYPPDWIGTPHPEQWTWQNDSWSASTVAEVMELRLIQMYEAINTQVRDIDDASYELRIEPDGSTRVTHDPRISAAMAGIDAFEMEQYLTEPLVLQHSDRDFYSFPEWNADLCARVNAAGGACQDFEYPENTHSLGVSEQRWFSSEEAVPGFPIAIQRDLELFRRTDSGKRADGQSDP